MLEMFLRLSRVWIIGMGLLLICVPVKGEEAPERAGKGIPQGFQLLPRVGILAEYGGFIVQQDNYTSLLRRRLEVDVLQYRHHIFYIDFDERTFFGTPSDSWEFNLMKYDVT